MGQPTFFRFVFFRATGPVFFLLCFGFQSQFLLAQNDIAEENSDPVDYQKLATEIIEGRESDPVLINQLIAHPIELQKAFTSLIFSGKYQLDQESTVPTWSLQKGLFGLDADGYRRQIFLEQFNDYLKSNPVVKDIAHFRLLIEWVDQMLESGGKPPANFLPRLSRIVHTMLGERQKIVSKDVSAILKAWNKISVRSIDKKMASEPTAEDATYFQKHFKDYLKSKNPVQIEERLAFPILFWQLNSSDLADGILRYLERDYQPAGKVSSYGRDQYLYVSGWEGFRMRLGNRLESDDIVRICKPLISKLADDTTPNEDLARRPLIFLESLTMSLNDISLLETILLSAGKRGTAEKPANSRNNRQFELDRLVNASLSRVSELAPDKAVHFVQKKWTVESEKSPAMNFTYAKILFRALPSNEARKFGELVIERVKKLNSQPAMVAARLMEEFIILGDQDLTQAFADLILTKSKELTKTNLAMAIYAQKSVAAGLNPIQRMALRKEIFASYLEDVGKLDSRAQAETVRYLQTFELTLFAYQAIEKLQLDPKHFSEGIIRQDAQSYFLDSGFSRYRPSYKQFGKRIAKAEFGAEELIGIYYFAGTPEGGDRLVQDLFEQLTKERRQELVDDLIEMSAVKYPATQPNFNPATRKVDVALALASYLDAESAADVARIYVKSISENTRKLNPNVATLTTKLSPKQHAILVEELILTGILMLDSKIHTTLKGLEPEHYLQLLDRLSKRDAPKILDRLSRFGLLNEPIRHLSDSRRAELFEMHRKRNNQANREHLAPLLSGNVKTSQKRLVQLIQLLRSKDSADKVVAELTDREFLTLDLALTPSQMKSDILDAVVIFHKQHRSIGNRQVFEAVHNLVTQLWRVNPPKVPWQQAESLLEAILDFPLETEFSSVSMSTINMLNALCQNQSDRVRDFIDRRYKEILNLPIRTADERFKKACQQSIILRLIQGLNELSTEDRQTLTPIVIDIARNATPAVQISALRMMLGPLSKEDTQRRLQLMLEALNNPYQFQVTRYVFPNLGRVVGAKPTRPFGSTEWTQDEILKELKREYPKLDYSKFKYAF